MKSLSAIKPALLIVVMLFAASISVTAQTSGEINHRSAPDYFLTAPGDENWDERFNMLDLNNDNGVSAIAVSGSDVYVGGGIRTAGGVSANRIAKWNTATSTWSALGSGVNGTVSAIAVSGNDVYVGGSFTIAGEVSANRIAKWNAGTNSWAALGSGVNGTVDAIAVRADTVYVGGQFTMAGGISANNIAMWNGSSWSALGSGTSGSTGVRAIAIVGSEVYVGGRFTMAGGIVANRIAKWNITTNNWSTLSSGVNSDVNALAVIGNEIYVGGNFTTAGGLSVSRIAKWNRATNTWSTIGSGVNGGVSAFAVSGNNLYVGGSLTAAGGVSANHVAKWDGSSWSALGKGVESTVNGVAVAMDGVYVVGFPITTAGEVGANNIARWNIATNSWSAVVGNRANHNYASRLVRAITVSGTEVYAGGDFRAAGGVIVNHVGKWNGSGWSALGSGVSGGAITANYGVVDAIAVRGDEVYVGGTFTIAGEDSAYRIARWNGNKWFPLGRGVSHSLGGARVNAIALNGKDVYVGGVFTNAGGVAVNNIAKWDSVSKTWSAVGSGGISSVTALAVSGNDLYVGGSFSTVDGVPANSIAKWNGSSWSALGNGVSRPPGGGLVSSIAVSGSDLYVGGFFSTAGDVPANNVAKWNGSSWSALGSGVSDVVNAIAVNGNEVYVGGRFPQVNTMLANYIARWNGSSWSTLGSGLNYYVHAVATRGSEVYVGGEFQEAGGKPSWYFALWHAGTTAVAENVSELPRKYALSQNFPNPFNPSTTIRYALPQAGDVTLKVYNLVGNEIETLVSDKQSAGKHEIRWNPVGLPSGVYFYRLKIEGFVQTKKLILIK